MHRFEQNDATLEIDGNRGTITLIAASPQDALKRARRIFRHMREVSVVGTADRYLVEFKVDPKYNRGLHKRAREIARTPLTRPNYEGLDPLERYMALLHAQLTGKETFLEKPTQLPAALLALENELIRQGHISTREDLMDYEIAVYNVSESD
jgi:hypothetical protein